MQNVFVCNCSQLEEESSHGLILPPFSVRLTGILMKRARDNALRLFIDLEAREADKDEEEEEEEGSIPGVLSVFYISVVLLIMRNR